MTAVLTDPRISSAIATRGEVASLLDVRADKLTAWATPQRGKTPLVHTLRGQGRLTVPLVGIAEAASLDALRTGGMSMQEARRAADYIRQSTGDEYALASPHLFTDGTEAFIEDAMGIVRMRDNQGALREVIAEHLRPLIIGPDGLVEAFRVEQFETASVTIDPRFNAGRMTFTHSRVPVFVVAGELAAGEAPVQVAVEYDLEYETVKEVKRLSEWLATVA